MLRRNLVLIGLPLLSVCLWAQDNPDHAFTVRDSIEMTTFSDPVSSRQGAIAKTSPDGRYSVVVTSRGLIESDQVESTLWIFDNQSIQRYLHAIDTGSSPKPKALARVSARPQAYATRSDEPVITDVRWSLDSRTVFYLAQNDEAQHLLYRVDIIKRNPLRLSPPGYDVSRFDFTPDSRSIAFIAWPSPEKQGPQVRSGGYSINRDARIITGIQLENVLFPGLAGFQVLSPELWLAHDGRIHQVRKTTPDKPGLFDLLAISPSGEFAVEMLPVTTIQDSWTAYKTRHGFEPQSIHVEDIRTISPYNILRLRQYELIDLHRGTVTPLTNAPARALGWFRDDSQIVWKADSREVLLTNTFLPLGGSAAEERSQRMQPCAAAVVTLRNDQVDCLAYTRTGGEQGSEPEFFQLQSAKYSEDDEVVLTFADIAGVKHVERYRRSDGRWMPTEDKTPRKDDTALQPATGARVILSVRQNLNDPPVLWATDARTGAGRSLWNPNMQFASMKFGEARVFRWKGADGYEWTGGLVAPVGYVAGKIYPLVIQTHEFDENAFITDGAFTTAMAARPLASAGAFVLQIKDKATHTMNQAEADGYLDGYRSAIRELSQQGLIDPQRVGIVGFSWTCWYVENALIKDPSLFAAATIVDGIDNSYMQYHLWGTDSPAIQRQAEMINGAKPIGEEGLQHWLRTAPGFHLDAVRTPLRIETIGPSSVLGEWELYSSLSQQDKPVDLIYLPEAEHVLQKPLERCASQQGNVDWFRFWLLEVTEDQPASSIRFQRWIQYRNATAARSGICS